MNIGRYIFSQIMDYIPRYQFDKLVSKYHGNKLSKELSCYNQLPGKGICVGENQSPRTDYKITLTEKYKASCQRTIAV
jgi:hypothetical protein